MVDELRSSISMALSRFWPSVEGRITSAFFDSCNELVVTYDFSIAPNKNYSGQAFAPFWFEGAQDPNIQSVVGEVATIRYRRNDPSVNTLDAEFWRNLEGI